MSIASNSSFPVFDAIQKEIEEQTGILDLGNCGITVVPREVLDLHWLEELIVSNRYFDTITEGWVESGNGGKDNRIDEIPEWIFKLKKLRRLVFSGDPQNSWGIKSTYIEFPESLEYLDLSFCGITDMRSLGLGPNLNYLKLAGNAIEFLDPFPNLKRLQTLDLSGNNIMEISSLRQLLSLGELNLGYNNIFDISVLVHLPQLEVLDLSGNEKIKDLAPLEQLIYLRRLSLIGFNLREVPFIAGMELLESLDLSDNSIYDWSAFRSLTKLKFLYLSENRITEVSDFPILPELSTLDLRNNHIIDISPLENYLRNGLEVNLENEGLLDHINLSGNPIRNPPSEVVQAGTRAILQFFDEQGGVANPNAPFLQKQRKGEIEDILRQSKPSKGEFRQAKISDADINDKEEVEEKEFPDPTQEIQNQQTVRPGTSNIDDNQVAEENSDQIAERTPTGKKVIPPKPNSQDEEMKTKLHSDQWAEEDYLGYERYAQAIHHIITDDESSPPLTFGIIAPWGQGKTTLMRYIWRRFDEDKKKAATKERSESEPEIRATTAEELNDNEPKEKLPPEENNKDWYFTANAEQIVQWSVSKDWNVPEKPVSFPRVWFNPWKYQSSEQVWAGMADAIINQLVATLSPLQQEEFWLKLQWKRIDRSGLRLEFYQLLFTRLLPNLLIFLVALIAGFIAILKFDPENVTGVPLWGGILSILAAGSSAFWAWWTWQKAQTEDLAKRLEPYLQSPDYSGQAGAFHHVNEDLKRVFELLVPEKEPALIFIDDLDRCAPQKVVEVIEAINLMMNAEFREKCYFILGMDAEMVAASIDVAYEKMKGLIQEKEQIFGSVGWYFLDKFIQLPFLIPTMRIEDKKHLIENLFGPEQTNLQSKGPEARLSEEEKEEIEEKAKEVYQQKDQGIEEVKKSMPNYQSQKKQKVFDRAFLKEGLNSKLDQKEVEEKITKFAEFLSPSPRSIKRFANLLRFHTSYQELRKLKGMPNANLETLTIWLIISLRWPKLIRWLQWHNEKGLKNFDFKMKLPEDSDGALSDYNFEIFVSNDPEEKAKYLDEILTFAIDDKKNSYTIAYELWKSLIDVNEAPHLNWLNDKSLFKFLYEQHNKETSFQNAYECGIW